VQVNPIGTTCLPTSAFHLTPGQSCILNLTVSGSVNRNDPDLHQHLLVCMSDKITCAGPTPENSLNVTQVSTLAHFANSINKLSTKGYLVAQGNAFLMKNTNCPLFISIFNSCFDQNPAAPYIIPQPPVEQSYVDPFYAQALTTPGPTGAPTNIIYRLADNDALVTIVSYPPLAAYLGYQSYVFTSASINFPIPFPLQIVSPDPSRFEIFGSVGNDVNSVIIQNKIGVPWGGKVVMYITTSNQELANTIIANVATENIDPNFIFVEPIGSNVKTGNGSTADDLVTLIRYAVPASASAANSWTNALSSNVLVYKVSKPNINVSRYGVNQYTARIDTTDERRLQDSLNQLAALLQTYLASAQPSIIDIKATIPSSQDNTSGIPSFGFVGSVCINKGTICNGDNQDTSTYAMLKLSMLGETETAFIAGINHNVVNNTYYVSDDISNAATSSGVASSSQTNPGVVGFDSGVLTGSALAVLQELGIQVPDSLRPALPYLYVTFIARNCNNPTIASAQKYCINLMGDSLIPASSPISFTERSYIRPGTTTGGNVNIMVYPQLIAATQDF